MSETVTRLRPQTSDDGHGNTIVDWSLPPARLDIPDCAVAPAGSTELITGQDVTTSGWAIYVTGDPDVTPTDALEVRGARYAVDGQPARYTHPSTGITKTVIETKRWGG